jgi:hypothetical protein
MKKLRISTRSPQTATRRSTSQKTRNYQKGASPTFRRLLRDSQPTTLFDDGDPVQRAHEETIQHGWPEHSGFFPRDGGGFSLTDPTAPEGHDGM